MMSANYLKHCRARILSGVYIVVRVYCRARILSCAYIAYSDRSLVECGVCNLTQVMGCWIS